MKIVKKSRKFDSPIQTGYWAGGSGTGDDVSSFTFTAWSLTAGSGGNSMFGAGGGGGLLVNGAGPIRPQQSEGEGYGGGGAGGGRSGIENPNGLPGVILIEITAE